MEQKIPGGLKTTFLIHIIVGAIFGVGMLLYPRVWSLVGVNVTEPAMYRLVGAAILAFSASSWWGYQAANREQVKIIVKAEVVWTTLATLVFLWGLLFEGLPAILWMNAVIMAAFAIAFGYYSSRL